MKARWLSLIALSLTGCGPTLSEALANHDWDAARSLAHEHSGDDKRRLDEWVRGQATLTVSVHAEEVDLPNNQQTVLTLPIRLKAKGKLAMTTLRSKGANIALRAGGIRWTNGGGDIADGWRTAEVVERLLGTGGVWLPYDEHTMLDAFFKDTGPKSDTPDVASGAIDEIVPLMPTGLGLGADALIVDALVEWPDAAVDSEAALHWQTIEFVIPLPAGDRLVDRVNALPTTISVKPSPHETPQLFGDL